MKNIRIKQKKPILLGSEIFQSIHYQINKPIDQ